MQTLLQVTSERGFKMETCPICCETIVDATEETEGQEALSCEGACQKDSYAVLTSSEEPSVYPSCSLAQPAPSADNVPS